MGREEEQQNGFQGHPERKENSTETWQEGTWSRKAAGRMDVGRTHTSALV